MVTSLQVASCSVSRLRIRIYLLAWDRLRTVELAALKLNNFILSNKLGDRLLKLT